MYHCAQLSSELDKQGSAVIPGLLTAEECLNLSSLYERAHSLRARPGPAAEGLSLEEKYYFDPALPEPVRTLREYLYEQLAPIANRWNTAMGHAGVYPAHLQAWLDQCRRAGQTRSLSALSRHGEGDYEALHRNANGTLVFPLQAVILLSEPKRDFTGGELVMTEQRPRMQSRPIVLSLRQGDAAVIAVHDRPFQGARGIYRVTLKHGVSRVRSGRRYALDLLFHDAP
ncbi:2OG-Fe(II) oxygenase [Paralcaligenes ginsengisoli]